MRLGPILLASLALGCGRAPEPRPAADPTTRRIVAQGELVGFSRDGG